MTPAARVAALIDLVAAHREGTAAPDAVARGYFRGRRYVGSKDRRAIGDAFFSVLRHCARLRWHLGEADPGPRALAIAHALLVDGEAPDTVHGWFTGDAYGPPPLDTAEAALIARLSARRLDDPAMPEAVRLELPDWAAAPLARVFGDRLAQEMAGFDAAAPLDLRVNALRAGRDDILAALQAQGFEAVATPFSPVGIRLARRQPIDGTALYRDGVIEVQDEASQIAALLTGAGPGEQVADLCAGALGKALVLAGMMQGRGRVLAADTDASRLARGSPRLKRAGADNIERRVLKADGDKWIGRQKGKFDRVLVDAPCSGQGTWRRDVDLRWRQADLTALAAVQTGILRQALRLVKPGGIVVYATCSLLKEENEDVVAAATAEAEGFGPVDAAAWWAEAIGTPPPPLVDGNTLRLSPATTGTDGFTVTLLSRAS
ncbi:MAG: RsmB/NOP family class I SAM-dependent RNA methyltransferase [Azospirillaceae bacterium]